MGGPIQPPGHLQTMVRLLIHGMNPQAVLDAPRWKLNGGKIARPRNDRFARVAGGLDLARTRARPWSPIPTWISAQAKSSCGPTAATWPPPIRGATARRRASSVLPGRRRIGSLRALHSRRPQTLPTRPAVIAAVIAVRCRALRVKGAAIRAARCDGDRVPAQRAAPSHASARSCVA